MKQRCPRRRETWRPRRRETRNDEDSTTFKIDRSGDDQRPYEGFVVILRGLPWSATAEDIIEFLSILEKAKVKGGVAGVHLILAKNGWSSGEAYVELESEKDLKTAIKKNHKYIGNRYIEVFRPTRSEMELFLKKPDSTIDSVLDDHFVHLRGLPYWSTKDDIVRFFQGLEMTKDGITITTNFMERSPRQAFVQFVDRKNAEKALQKHKEKIGQNCIGIFRSSLAEFRKQALKEIPRQTPYDRMHRFDDSFGGGGHYFDMSVRAGRNMKSIENNGSEDGGRNVGGPRRFGRSQAIMGGGIGREWYSNNSRSNAPSCRPVYVVHMRGLPFKVNKEDIVEFFEPLDPVEITIPFNNNRPSGVAIVKFACKKDAKRAMSKNKTYMQHKCIELFMDGPVGGGPEIGRNNTSTDYLVPPNAGSVEMFEGGDRVGWNGNNWNAHPSIPLYVIHMRGLPFKVNKEDIVAFFKPLDPVEITILFNNNRPSGKANVKFASKEDVKRAMSKDKTLYQHRYIELFLDGPVGGGPEIGHNNTSTDDLVPPNAGSGGDVEVFEGSDRVGWNGNNWNAHPSIPLYVVHMRGLPFKAIKEDISEFFKPLDPVEITILFNNNRPSGEANVKFASKEDVKRAMSKDKTLYQHRYIELFMDGPLGDKLGTGVNNFNVDYMVSPNADNVVEFESSSFGSSAGSYLRNNTFSRCKNDNNFQPPNSFCLNNMSGGIYQIPSRPRNMSGPGSKFIPFEN